MQVHTLLTGVANTHLVETEKGIVVVDAGLPHHADRILARIRALGHAPQDVRLIFVTHGHIDHAGSAAELARLSGAPIAMHALDAPLVATSGLKIPPGRNQAIDALGKTMVRFERLLPLETFQPDICVVDGQSLKELGIAARVLHTPGHTAGSSTLVFEDGTIFCGDAILNLVRVSFPLWWEDAQAAGESACRICALKPRLCYSGHGRPFSFHQLDAFVSKHCRRTR